MKGGLPLKKYRGNEVEAVYCNSCGKEMEVEHGIIKEGVFEADISWGYFSEKDGERHNFDMCEECYNLMIEKFKIPVERRSLKEFL